MKKCPYCAEEIQDEAIYCRWCKHDLTKSPDPMHTQSTRNYGSKQYNVTNETKEFVRETKKSHKDLFILLALLGLMIIVVIIWIAMGISNSNNSPIVYPTDVPTRTEISSFRSTFTPISISKTPTKPLPISTKIPTKIPTEKPTNKPPTSTFQPTIRNPEYNITIKVTNYCSEQATVIFEGPMHLKYVVDPGATQEWQATTGIYTYTINGYPGRESPAELWTSVWTLTLCP